MRVSTKALFNQISKNVKATLEKSTSAVDSKNSNLENIQQTNAKKLIESLFKDLSDNTKTKESVLANIKENNIPKQMQNTTKELTSLLNLLKADKALAKYAPILEKLLLHVKDINPENLKSELAKSGVFMESKLSSTKTQIMPTALKEVLTALKEAISKDAPKESLHVKTIDILLNAKKADKGFVNTLASLIKSVKNSSDLSKQIEQSLSKLENIIKQNGFLKDSNVKEVLANLKEAINKDNLHVKTIDTLLNAKKADKGFVDTLASLVKSIKNSPDLSKQIEQPLSKLENIIKQNIPLKESNVKEVLANLKEAILKDIPKDSLHVKMIDKILGTLKADKAFLQDIKTLLSDLKNAKNINKSVIDITAKLESLIQKSALIESKMQNNLPVTSKEAQKVANQIKEAMSQLKELVSKENIKNVPALLEKSQNIASMVEQTLKMPDFFPKGLDKAAISEKLQQVVNILKSELIKTDAKNSLHVEVSKLTQNLETVIKEQIATKNIVPNQKFMVETPIKAELLNDVKATLLNIKHELSSSTLPTHREVLTQVDRLLTQIDYFQLVSLSSNSNTTYLPFSWDSLEGGQISLKKLKENRFFCEINLTLKEYGKIDLMIMLFEDIHVTISVFAEKKEFTALIQENLLTLKQGINKLGLIPSSVQLFDALKDKKLKEDTRNFVSSTQLGSGLNIEV